MATEAAFLDEVAAFLESEYFPSPRKSISNDQSKSMEGMERRKKYRQRLKNEREELRQATKKLARKLDEIRAEKEGRKTKARTNVSLSYSFWRDVALRQRELRQQSEAQQKKLFVAVTSQAAYVEHLSGAFREQRQQKAISSLDEEQIGESKWIQLKASDTAVFDIYVDEIDASYARVDQVFEECKMESRPQQVFYWIHRREEDDEVEYFQHINKILHPFSFEDTSRAMWKFAKLPHRLQDREVYQATTNTIALKFRQTRTLNCGSVVSIVKRVVCRRYVEAARHVFVWKSFTEGEGIFTGMDTTETSWITIRASEDSQSEAIMEVCSRQVPVPFASTKHFNLPVDQFQEMILSEVKLDEVEVTKSMKTLLLHDTLKDLAI